VAVSLVPAAVETSQGSERVRSRARAGAPWLIAGCYLLGALALTWRLWADPASRAQVGDAEDVDLYSWFLRYAATAVAHGHLPALVSTAMNAPRGINLMGNTSFLLPGMLLTPVTLLAGPQVSLAIVLTLGFAGSAASLFWVLRRWGASLAAAALGGALYGFSPAMLDSGIGHPHMQFAVLPPLMIDALLRIVTGRGHPVRAGVWLGLLSAAQLFTGEELLAQTAIAGLVLVVALAASHPRAVRARARDAALGLGTGAVIALLICGRALWVQLRGPLSSHGGWEPLSDPWYSSHLWAFVTPPGDLFFHTRASVATVASGHDFITEYLAYLGWPLLVVLVVAAMRFWRDPRVRAAAVTWAVLEVFSLGAQSRTFLGVHVPGGLLPWHWVQGLPLIAAMLPDRFPLLADGAAAAVLAFSLDLARSAAPGAAVWRQRGLPFAVAVLAVLPLIPLPYQASAGPPVPAGWQAAFAGLRLAPDARVLVVPVPFSHQPEVLRWQADTGQPGSLIGGWFVGPNQAGQASVMYFGPHMIADFFVYLDALWSGSSLPRAPSRAQIQADLAYLRPAAVVAVTSRGSPLEHFLTRLFGQPAVQVGRMLGWRR
jgi:dolichyl-phosphate beta-glucosyltransferase